MDSSAVILVVDDDPSLLQAMAWALQTAGQTILEAAKVREVLQL